MSSPDDLALPIVAITMGDPAGIGPEIIAKALVDPQTRRLCRPVVIGDADRLALAADICGLRLTINRIHAVSEALHEPRGADCIDLGLVPDALPFGDLTEIAGEAAYRAVELAARLAVDHEVQAICTGPLNKEALHMAGHRYPGHTEMLADLTGTAEVSMMLTSPKVRVVHVTTHIGLRDMIDRIEPGVVFRTIQRGHAALEAAGNHNPRIAVCGINPHAGDTVSSVTGKRSRRSRPELTELARRGSMRMVPSQLTPCSTVPAAATSTSLWPCTTTRAMARSRCKGWRAGSTSPSGFR
jgi:4-phospho-D-threonate 3-dehydrogenase / 4-phospho-D-erythronate 3-dehydrogenase